MATSPPVFTTKTAIIIGAVVFVGIGIAIGATVVANIIDSNSLTQYRDNPKFTGWVTLNDNPDGHKVGWNPIAGDQQSNYGKEMPETKYERYFTILDSEIEDANTVLAFVLQSVRIEAQNDRGETLEPAFMHMPCMTSPFDGGFFLYCDGNDLPKNSSPLRYLVLSQQ
jgi:hypothetical protein